MYDNSLTKIDDLIPENLKVLLKEKAPIIIPHNQPCSPIIINQLASQKATNKELIFWAYKVEALREISSFHIIYPVNVNVEQILRKNRKIFSPYPKLPSCDVKSSSCESYDAKSLSSNVIEIHEFSTGIYVEGTPDNWYSRGFTGSYMNSTLEEIPIAVQNALGYEEFEYLGEFQINSSIIGREVQYNGDSWSVIVVVNRARDDGGRWIGVSRYFLSQGLGKLSDILFWYTEIANEPIFNPFDKKEMDKPYLYDTSLTKIDDLISENLKDLLKEETPIIIPHNQPRSPMIMNQLASQKATNKELIFWIYKGDFRYSYQFRYSYRYLDNCQVIYPVDFESEERLASILQLLSSPLCSVPPPTLPPTLPPTILTIALFFLLGIALYFLAINLLSSRTSDSSNIIIQVKNNFFGVFPIIFLTITICVIPTIAHWLTQEKSRIARSLLESLLFIGLLLGFSWWMFGLSILGFWVIPSILLILVLEIGANIIELYKISTLERLAEELTFEKIQDKANEIEQLFKNELSIYVSVPLGLFLGIISGKIYNLSQVEMMILSFKIVLILASIILIYFLCIAFERMSDSLFKESDISSPSLEKERKDLRGLFTKFYKLVVPSRIKLEDEDIELACIVGDLRKIYFYDAIHNGLLLIIVGIIISQFYEINFINQKFAIITIITWLFIVIGFNLLPYAIGQASLHSKILKKYKGIKRIQMLEQLRKSSPLLPLTSFLYGVSDNGGLSLQDFLFNPTWNSTFRKMLNLMEKNERERNRLLKEMAEKPTYNLQNPQFGGGFAGQDYIGDVTHNYASDKNLAEAAKEIQQLLDQLSQTYPTNSTKEKIVVATKALEEIQKNPNLAQRIFRAFKAGGTSALEQSLNHPAASFVINFIKDLQENQDSNPK
jgi:hypothetical protein